MRFNLLARRIMAPAAGLALAATLAACSSSSSTSTGTGGSGSPTASSPAATGSSTAPASSGSSSNSAAVAQITANWATFFDGKTSAAKKISLLQNGQRFAAIIRAQAGSTIAGAVSAKVKAVVVNSATSATVSYDILASGQPALANQTGTAVYEGGIWKVGDVSFCQLLKLQGPAPSVCG